MSGPVSTAAQSNPGAVAFLLDNGREVGVRTGPGARREPKLCRLARHRPDRGQDGPVVRGTEGGGWSVVLAAVGPEDWRRWRALRLAALAEAPWAFSSTLAQWSGPGDTEARWKDRLAGVALNLVAS